MECLRSPCAHTASQGLTVRPGLAVAYSVGKDRQGRAECRTVCPPGTATPGAAADGRPGEGMVQLRCFSMNQPFAGLVAHGHKTLETRK